jgi:protein TonB
VVFPAVAGFMAARFSTHPTIFYPMKQFWGAWLMLPGLFLGAMPAAAQTAEPVAAVALRPKKIEYFSAERRLLPTAEGASYRLETTYRDSIAGNVRKYDAAGKLKSMTAYGHLQLKIRHGVSTTWYENGQMHTKEDYVAGQPHGELLVYYPDGTLRRRDQFAKGERTAGQCFGPDGQPVAYFDYLQPPVYSEGAGDMQAVARAAVHKGVFPEVVAQMGMDANILVRFTVNEQGRVEQVHALPWKPEHPYPRHVLDGFQRLQQEAEWNVAHLKAFRPALLDGQPVAYELTVPINFRVLD